MISDRYAKMVFDDGRIHIIPAGDNIGTEEELIQNAIQEGLDQNCGEFAITIGYSA